MTRSKKNSLKFYELKQKLKSLGLVASGNKVDLLNRIVEADPEGTWTNLIKYHEDLHNIYRHKLQVWTRCRSITATRDTEFWITLEKLIFCVARDRLIALELEMMRRELLRNIVSVPHGYERNIKSHVNIKAVSSERQLSFTFNREAQLLILNNKKYISVD